MRAALMYGAGDVRVETVPDPKLIHPTDALGIVRACICGSDLHPYHQMTATEQGSPMGHEFVGIVEEIGAEVRTISRVGAPQYEDAPVGFGSLFGRNITLTGGPAPVRAYIEELLPEILDGRLQPGKVFDRTVGLDGVPAGYQAMDDRDALKVMVAP